MAVAVAQAPRNQPRLGGLLDNEDVGINWHGGIEQQGAPFEDYVARQYHDLERLEKGSKTWDIFTFGRRAISCKTLNTRLGGYASNPKRVFSTLKRYIDAAANYKPRYGVFLDIDPSEIREREIHLGIPEYTSYAQWKQINAAIDYANRRGVILTVTRIR